jgi:hypothetical protein
MSAQLWLEESLNKILIGRLPAREQTVRTDRDAQVLDEKLLAVHTVVAGERRE